MHLTHYGKVVDDWNQIILALRLAVIKPKTYLLQPLALCITVNPYLAMPIYNPLTITDHEHQ